MPGDISLFVAGYIAGMGCNLLYAILFLFLRTKATPGILTKSQRWGLTLLGAIFVVNTLEILFILSASVYHPGWDERYSPTIPYDRRVLSHLTNLSFFLILGFGLVFPRPLLPWKKLRWLLIAVGTGSALMVAIPAARGELWENPWLHAGSLFIFPFIWIRQSFAERSVQSRMVLAILSWGFLFTPFIQALSGKVTYFMSDPVPYFGDGIFLILAALLVMIAYSLWLHRTGWSAAEQFHCIMLAVTFALSIAYAIFAPELSWPGVIPINRQTDLPEAIITFLAFNGGWMLVRPFLFSVGLLRYQLFGTEIKADIYINIINWAVNLLIVTAVIQGFFIHIGDDTRIIIAVVSAVVLAYPLWLLVRRLNRRLLPLTAGEAKASMADKRAAYQLGLQTAVVSGEIDDEFDFFALKNLRKKLQISEREHQLIMTYFPKRVKTRSNLEELFLITSDGRLVAHGGKLEGEMDLVAGMLTAIRGFVREGLQGGKRELDTVKYGDYTLMMESEEKMVLAALVLGPETTDLRVLLRDNLAEVMRQFGPTLRSWDGEMEKVSGTQDILVKALETYKRPAAS